MLGNVIQGQRVFLGLVLIYIGIGLAGRVAGLPIHFNFYGGIANAPLAVFLTAFLWWRTARIGFIKEPGRPIERLWRDVRRCFTMERIAFAAPAIILFPVVLSIYSSWKCLIPQFTIYDWDPTLAAIDRALHGGDVWRLLHPLLGEPPVSLILHSVYASWFWMVGLIGVWQMVSRGPAREQFLVSSVLCWGVVGTVGAMGFASVGPVFYGRLLGEPDPFAELAAYIHSIPMIAAPQDWLWAAYAENRIPEAGKGISAMPSLHVAVATLNALVAWRSSRLLGWALSIYAALVALASVHLGWHYAIDAYAGAAVAMLIWSGVGWGLNRFNRPAPAPYLA